MAVTEPHLHITFFSDPVRDGKASREEGRPVFKEVEFARIKYVGNRKNELVARAHEKFIMAAGSGDHLTYAERFPDHYAAFRAGAAQANIGMPLDMLTFLTPSRRAELAVANITTVEGLAAVSDRDLSNMGQSTRREREQAQEWLAKADRGAEVNLIAAENAELRARLERLEMRQQPVEVTANDPEGWTDEQLREYLTENGAAPRANAARDKMVEAARLIAAEPVE